MKKRDLSKLALLGLTAGVMVAGQTGVEAIQEGVSFDVNSLLAKPHCKGKNGCGGFMAERDVAPTAQESKSEDEDNDEEDEDEDKDEGKLDVQIQKTTPSSKGNTIESKRKGNIVT